MRGCVKKLVIAISLMLTILAAQQRAWAEGIWDSFRPLLEKQGSCAKHPKHDSCKPTTAAKLLMRCDSADPENVAYCLGSLMGLSSEPEALIELQCVPREVWRNPEQLRRLFVREANRTPEVLHLPARQLLYYSVAKAFPCPLRGRPGR